MTDPGKPPESHPESPPDGAEPEAVEGTGPDSPPAAVPPPPPSPTGRGGSEWGRVLVGVLLVTGGVLWFLDSADVLTVSWQLVLSVFLMVVGAALLIGRRRRSGLLVAVGVVLTVLLAVGSLLPSGLSPSVGQRAERPHALSGDLEYNHAAGSLRVDLRNLVLDEDRRVSVGLGMGELVVRVPAQVELEVRASVGMGEAEVLGESRSGVGVRLDDRSGSGPVVLTLDLSVGMGRIEVTR